MSRRLNQIIAEDLQSITKAPLPWYDLSGATVLITGAAGFLPAYMVETLLFLNDHFFQRPAQVIAVVRDLSRAEARFSAYQGRDDFKLVVQNISEPLAIPARFDYIIHAASQASPVYYNNDPVGTLSPNVLGTYQLLQAARAHPTRGFLFFSSGEVYGLVTDTSRPMAEHDGGFSDPAVLRACYSESKRMGETMCVAWAHQFSVPTRIARPFHTYGPGMRLDDGRVFADFVRNILDGGPIVLKSNGLARRSFCYLADATVGFFTVLLLGANGEAYNVADPGGECSISELAARLAATFHDENVGVSRQVRADTDYIQSTIVSTVPDIGKIKSLGWTPKTLIEEGFRRTVMSYR